MALLSRLFSIVILSFLIAGAARATPVSWSFVGVTLSDGGTVSGGFTFDASAGTPCSTSAATCGVFSNVDVVTTTGSSLPGATYTAVCGADVPSCSGLTPNSTEVLLLTSTLSDQLGLPAIAIFFTGFGFNPPAGLTDSGLALDVSNSGPSVGAIQEAACIDAICSAPAPPSRFSVSGFVVPEPSTWAVLLVGLAMLGATHRRSLARVARR